MSVTPAFRRALPFRFTDKHGAELFAATAQGLRLAFDLAGLNGTDGNIEFLSETDPGYGVSGEVRVAFRGTPVKWFFHHSPATKRLAVEVAA